MANTPIIINDTTLGKDISSNGIFGNLTPGGTFSNTPLFYQYNPTKDSDVKLTLTLQKVKDSIKKQLNIENGSSSADDKLVESFLYEFTSLLIDYRDLRNHVFFGSAYTELAYNIKFIIDNYPYLFLISTKTNFLDTENAEFTYSNNVSKEQTTIYFNESAIKDCQEEFNFFDNNIDFNWLNYDLVDKNNTRYPIINVITPYQSTTIFDIQSITLVTVNDSNIPYDTLQIQTTSPHGYLRGQAINITDNLISENTLNDNYIISKIISADTFLIVNKYAGNKILQNDLDLVTEAVNPIWFSNISTGYLGKARMFPLSLNQKPYTIKLVVEGNFTEAQFLNYKDDLNIEYSGFTLSPKQSIVSDFYYNLTPVQKMLLSPAPINPTPWPRRIETNNIQHLTATTDVELDFINWLKSPTNSYIKDNTDQDDDLAASDIYNEYRLVRALALDETATNQLLRRCIPSDVISELNDTNNAYFQRFILIAGWLFDQINMYIKFIKYTHSLNYSDYNQLSPQYYRLYADYYGFELFDDDSIDFSKLVVQTEPGYYFDTQAQLDTSNKYYRFTLQQLQYERQKRLLLSLFYLYKTKGTPGAVKKLVSLLGAPEGLLIFDEYTFDIQNTDSFDYYDVATLRGFRTVNNEKVNTPDVNFEIDPDFPVPNGMPPVYRMRLNNESQMNLRMASIQTSPNGAIDYQIINLFGKQKYNYAKFGKGEFATLQNSSNYYALPLTIPDKFSGVSVEYMIPKDGFTKGIGNNLDEVTCHICSLFQLSNENVPVLINNVYSYPLPEVFSNFDYSSIRTTTSDTIFPVDNEPNIQSDFDIIHRYFGNTYPISVTKPYIICRQEGKDLVVRIRILAENAITSDIGERVAVVNNIFEADGLNHTLKLIFRAEGIEVYKDYKHISSTNNNIVGITLWQDPTSVNDPNPDSIDNGIPYCAFEIPKERIQYCDFKPFNDKNFISNPSNQGTDSPKYWDVFIGLPINIDFYFKRLEVFENYSIDSYDIESKLLNDKNYTAEYYSFDFTNNSGDTSNISIKCQFSKMLPNILPADYSYILPVEGFGDNLIVIKDLNLTSKSFDNINLKYFNTIQDFFNVQTDIFSENAYQKNIHKDYYYDNFNGKLNELYNLYSPQVLTYSSLLGFLDLIENKFQKTIKKFIPIVIDISEFGRLITNSIFNQKKVRYTNIENFCTGEAKGDYAIAQVRIFSPETYVAQGENLNISLINPNGTYLINPFNITWDTDVQKTMYSILAALRNSSINPSIQNIIPFLNNDLLVVRINMEWYNNAAFNTNPKMNANDVEILISNTDDLIIYHVVFDGGEVPSNCVSNCVDDSCGSITYSLPVVKASGQFIYFESENQLPTYLYFTGEGMWELSDVVGVFNVEETVSGINGDSETATFKFISATEFIATLGDWTTENVIEGNEAKWETVTSITGIDSGATATVNNISFKTNKIYTNFK